MEKDRQGANGIKLGLAKHKLSAPGGNFINGGKAGAPERAGRKVPTKPKGRAVLSNLLDHIQMCLNYLGRRLERHMQVVFGVGHGAEKVGFVRPFVYENRVVRHGAPPRQLTDGRGIGCRRPQAVSRDSSKDGVGTELTAALVPAGSRAPGSCPELEYSGIATSSCEK